MRWTTRLRAVAVVLATAGMAWLPLRVALGPWSDVTADVTAGAPAGVDAVVALVAAAAAAATALWLVVAVAASAAEAVRTVEGGRTTGRHGSRRPGARGPASPAPTPAARLAPHLLRRVVLVLVTASLLTPGAANAATAAGDRGAPPRHVAAVAAHHPGAQGAPAVDPLVPGWLTAPVPPPRTVAVASAPGPALRAATTRTEEVVVRRGDTLWDIAARHLGPGASDAEVLAAWPAWYEANRAVVGPDPDRLLPGQRLVPPVAADGSTGGTR